MNKKSKKKNEWKTGKKSVTCTRIWNGEINEQHFLKTMPDGHARTNECKST